MILKFRGELSFSAPATDVGGSTNSSGKSASKCYIGGRPLVEAVVDAEPEGIVTVAFPGHRFHGEIDCPTASDYAKRPEERLNVNGEDVLAALKQHEDKRVWFWLADKPLNAVQLTMLGVRYLGVYPPCPIEESSLPVVETEDWENAYQCFSEALLLDRNDARLIGLFVNTVLGTDRLNKYGPVMLIQMLNRAIELEPDDISEYLDVRAALLDLIGDTEQAAADRQLLEEIAEIERAKSYSVIIPE